LGPDSSFSSPSGSRSGSKRLGRGDGEGRGWAGNSPLGSRLGHSPCDTLQDGLNGDLPPSPGKPVM
jgi:hypothetical protein